MRLPRPLAMALCLAPATFGACAGPEPAPTPPPGAPAAQPSLPGATGTSTAAGPAATPQAVYASQTELAEMYAGQITVENLDAILDQIEAEIEADSSEVPD